MAKAMPTKGFRAVRPLAAHWLSANWPSADYPAQAARAPPGRKQRSRAAKTHASLPAAASVDRRTFYFTCRRPVVKGGLDKVDVVTAIGRIDLSSSPFKPRIIDTSQKVILLPNTTFGWLFPAARPNAIVNAKLARRQSNDQPLPGLRQFTPKNSEAV
jgi:hypothetical protein